MTVELINGVVEITGTNGADVYHVTQTNSKLLVGEGALPNQTVHEFNPAEVIRIKASLLGGNDRLLCDDSVQIPVTADGGTGLDIMRGGSANDRLTGGDNGDAIDGRGGNDTVDGGAGPDALQGWIGDDSLIGGDANDTLFGGVGNDTLRGGIGVDRAHGNEGDDVIFGEASNDWLWGDQGFDRIEGGDDHGDRIWGGTENDTLSGGIGNDSLMGDEGSDILAGELGSDSLNGGEGTDTLDGGQNRDTLVGGDGRDDLDGGDGPDLLFGDGAGSANPGPDLLRGGNGPDRLNGDGGNDHLFGNGGNDTLLGGAGNDEARGNVGNDRVRGGDGRDVLYGGDGNDTLLGEGGTDRLHGEAGTDTLDGGTHADTLVSIDDDTLDTLFGRAGFDTFWVDGNSLSADQVLDATANEADTNVHLVDAFRNGPDKTLNGDGIIDPSGGESSASFAGRPLFSDAGPAVSDIRQQALGDCWLLASLAAAVDITPNVARQLVVDLGDGTFAVRLEDQILGTERYYRLDADLPVTVADPITPQFAGLGAQDSLWVAMVEKAVAMDQGNDYQNLAGGNPFAPLGQLGGTNRRMHVITSGNQVLTDIRANNWAGVYTTRNDQANTPDLLANHAYGIIAILIGFLGEPSGVVLYNPHGVDNVPLYNANGTPKLDANGEQMFGSADGNDDGFITLNMAQFAANCFDPIGVYTADYNRYL